MVVLWLYLPPDPLFTYPLTTRTHHQRGAPVRTADFLSTTTNTAHRELRDELISWLQPKTLVHRQFVSTVLGGIHVRGRRAGQRQSKRLRQKAGDHGASFLPLLRTSTSLRARQLIAMVSLPGRRKSVNV